MDWISLVTTVLKIIGAITGWLHDRNLIDAGAAQATGAALAAANAELQKASQVAQDADQKHREDPTDGAFDSDFERKD
jgi:hypothetical protein